MLLLASASPRRAELLSQLEVNYKKAPVDIDETPDASEIAVDYVVRMAHEKAHQALKLYAEDGLVILAADTTVVVDQKILGKPENFDDFSRMMGLLSGRQHQVYTAVSVVKKTLECFEEKQVFNENTVQFTDISEQDILWYWQTGEPVDKAGGYGIQGQGARFVKSINGSYSGIVGLPLYETAEILIALGILDKGVFCAGAY